MHRPALAILIVLAIGPGVPAAAQKRPRPSADLPATLTFACTATDFSNVFCPNADHIVGDSRLYPGTGAPETGQGAWFRDSNKELWLGFGQNVYKMLIDFTDRADVPPCAVTNSCRLPSAFPNSQTVVDVEDGEIQSNVVSGPGGAELPNGLLDLDVGESGHARLKISFQAASLSSSFTIRFNPFEYPGSNEIPVTRTSVCTWLFEADGDDDDANGTIEPLAGIPGTYNKQTKTWNHEGLFVFRFSMTLRVPGLCQ